MSSSLGRVLVAGASGLLGGRVAGKLLDRKVPVRALTRAPGKVAELARRGAEVVQGDLLRPESLAAACAGVDQIFSSANSFMGTGPTSPVRVDVPGYRNLGRAAEQAGVRRMVHTSALGIEDVPVDFFRVKTEVDRVIRGGSTPWALLRPTAFLDVWVGIALDQAGRGPVMVFGSGNIRANYVSVEDVAQIAVKVLEHPEIVNEEVPIGGPSNLTQHELLDLMERVLGRKFARKSAPRVVLRVGSVVVRPFNELAARFMAMGAWASAADRSMDSWLMTARRFGIEPLTAEQYLAGIPKEAA